MVRMFTILCHEQSIFYNFHGTARDDVRAGDKKMFYQQNNKTRSIALVVLSTAKWKILRQQADSISDAIFRAHPRSYK